MINLGKKINEENLKAVCGGAVSIKAVGTTVAVSGALTVCPKCGGTELVPQCFSVDNGRTAYNGQECLSCGAAMVYGDNIL